MNERHHLAGDSVDLEHAHFERPEARREARTGYLLDGLNAVCHSLLHGTATSLKV